MSQWLFTNQYRKFSHLLSSLITPLVLDQSCARTSLYQHLRVNDEHTSPILYLVVPRWWLKTSQSRRLHTRKWKKVKVLVSPVQLFATPWTVAYQAPLSLGFSRQEYQSELSFPPPGDFPDPRIKPQCPALQADSLPPEPPGSPIYTTKSGKCYKATLLPHRPPPPRACSTSTAPAQTKHQPQPHTQDGLLTQGPFCFIIINVFIVNIHTHSILTATPQAMSSV